jgi:hypothetical protein
VFVCANLIEYTLANGHIVRAKTGAIETLVHNAIIAKQRPLRSTGGGWAKFRSLNQNNARSLGDVPGCKDWLILYTRWRHSCRRGLPASLK